MKRDRNPHLPPVSRVPENLAGIAYFEIEEYHVGSWSPLPDGKGPATQVHFTLRLRGIETPLVLRLQSARAADELIAALERHRFDVWPTG
jgi:hypothetical protein